MTIMGSNRGAFRAIELDASGGKGVQLTVPGGEAVGANSLVTSFDVQQAENFSVSQCLNKKVTVYTFGHDPQRSQFTVGVTLFLNTCGGSPGAELEKAIKAYRAGRLSESKELASLTVGTGLFRGYLVGQGLAVVNSELGMVNATYNFIALDVH